MVTARGENSKNVHRVSVSLSDETIKKLQDIAVLRGVDMTEAIRLAISTDNYIQKEIEKGGRIIVEKPDKTFREVVFN